MAMNPFSDDEISDERYSDVWRDLDLGLIGDDEDEMYPLDLSVLAMPKIRVPVAATVRSQG